MDCKRGERDKVKEIVEGNARRFRCSGEQWFEPFPMEFQDLDAAETFEVHKVTPEEEDVAKATVVKGNADNCEAEVTVWAIRMSGFFCTYNSK